MSAATSLATAGGPRGDAVTAAEEPAVWQSLPDGPPLYGHVAVYDAAARRMVLHGGERVLGEAAVERLAFDLSADRWVPLAFRGESPQPRLAGRGLLGSPAVVVDRPSSGADVLAVCDCRNGATHQLDLPSLTWSRPLSEDEVLRHGPILAHDAAARRVVLFGGREWGIGDILATGYVYDLSAPARPWLSLPPAPFHNLYQAVAVDPATRHVLAFGGQNADADAIAELWRLDLARLGEDGAWEDITALAGPGPSRRMDATLTYLSPAADTADGARFLLFGGYDGSSYLADAWLLDYTDPAAPRWLEMTDLAGGPEGRSAHAAAWDPIARRVVVYGGLAGTAAEPRVLADAWALPFGGPAHPTPPIPTTSPTGEAPPGPIYLPGTLRRAGF